MQDSCDGARDEEEGVMINLSWICLWYQRAQHLRVLCNVRLHGCAQHALHAIHRWIRLAVGLV